jgi:NADH-quinone oxidoreductase subunit F
MDLDIVSSVQENIIGNCLCVLGDSMAMPVGAMVRKFRHEFEEAIARASDEVAGQAAQGGQGVGASAGGSGREAEQPPVGGAAI